MARGQGGGRPTKPTHLKVLHGDRGDRVNTAEPVPVEGEIVAPFELSPEAQLNWQRLAPDRITKGVLTVWDVDAFAQFCEALVRAQQAFAGADMADVKRAVDVCATLGGRFGWTPSDRAKLIIRREPDGGAGKERYLTG